MYSFSPRSPVKYIKQQFSLDLIESLFGVFRTVVVGRCSAFPQATSTSGRSLY